jgi:hypothetical protein
MKNGFNTGANEETAVPLKTGASGFKVLQVTKITSNGDNNLTRNDIRHYVNNTVYNSDTIKDKDSCIKIMNKRLGPKRWSLRDGPEDTISHQRIFNTIEAKGFSTGETIVNYYYVKSHGAIADSFIFVEHGWACPDYKSFLLFPNKYDGINYQGRFNYIGNNQNFTKNGLSLKPFYSAKYHDTVFTPVIAADDSSSIMINSVSGFEIKYQQMNALQTSQREIKIILDSILAGNTHLSCFDTITVEKLGTIDGISRFTGLIKKYSCYDGCYTSECFVADIKNEQCFLMLLQFNPAYFAPAFYCAYSFGEGNLPDVFVWSITNERDAILKEIYYISNRCWAHTETDIEYTGDCFEEEEYE